MLIWMAYIGDNIVPLYYQLLRKQDAKEIEEARQQLLQRFAHVVKLSGLLNGEDAYFMGSQFTVIDCAILPFLERMAIVVKHWKGVDIFATRNENEDVNKWYKYWQYARQRPSFQRTLYDLSWLPELPQNPLTKHLGFTDFKNFDPVKYMCEVYEVYAKPQ